MEARADGYNRAQLEQRLRAYGETRPLESVIAQYEYEREMANRLRNATREERRSLYAEVYDTLYKRFPDHPGLAKRDTAERMQQLRHLFERLRPLLTPDSCFLEIGAGDCLLAYQVAQVVKKVYALEVSAEKVAAPSPGLDNFELVLFDGFHFPFPDATFDVAFSNQVLEHLHPEDAREHLQQVYRLLKPNGRYICIVPHRFTGPHDISRYFTQEATGLHLKEYTYYELAAMFHQVGFARIRGLIRRRWVPVGCLTVLERLLEPFPYHLRKKLAHRSRVLRLVGLTGQKVQK
jgi:SAM-dependent methyltransferase